MLGIRLEVMMRKTVLSYLHAKVARNSARMYGRAVGRIVVVVVSNKLSWDNW